MMIYGEVNKLRLSALWRCIRNLEHGKQKLLHTGPYSPDGYEERKLPKAIWLSEKGAEYADEKFPGTNPQHHGPERSKFTLHHDVKVGKTHNAIHRLASWMKAKIGWEKQNDFEPRLVKHDGLAEITLTKTTRFFLEEENVKKSLEELYEKFKVYIEFWGTQKFKDEWGFSHFYVLVPMRNEAAAKSAVVHFAGGCNCIDTRHKKMHAKAPFQLTDDKGKITDILLFTTHELMTTNTKGKIFLTPADFESKSYSLLDIVR